MELLVSVSFTVDNRPRHVDVVVDAEPTALIESVRVALAAFARSEGAVEEDLASLALVRDTLVVALDPARSIEVCGLLSGDRLVLGRGGQFGASRAQGPASEGERALTLDITSGPGAGRSVRLRPGTYSVGRAPDNDVSIDDQTMSRHHFDLRVADDLAVTLLPDPQASNGTAVGSVPAPGERPLSMEDTVFAGSSQFVLRDASFVAIGERDRLGQIGHNSGPYRRPVVHERSFEDLEAPPMALGKRRFPLAAIVVPLLASVAAAVLLHQAQFLLFALLSPVMMVSNQVSEGRTTRQAYREDRERFRARVSERRAAVDDALEQERQVRLTAAPDVMLLSRHAAGRLARLWERHPDSGDFLQVRLGLGDVKTRIVTKLAPGGDNVLRDEANEQLQHAGRLSLVPITLDLDVDRVVGFYGDDAEAAALVRSVISQIAVLQSPEHVVLAAALPEDARSSWSWLGWLPHTRAATSPIEGNHVCFGADAELLVQSLYEVLADRDTQPGRTATQRPAIVLLLHEGAAIDPAYLAPLIEHGSAVGLHVLWLGASWHRLPRQCRATVRCAGTTGTPGLLDFTDPEREPSSFDVEGIPLELADTIARSLAPVRDVSAMTVTTSMPKLVTLFDVLPHAQPTPDAIARQWKHTDPHTLQAFIGMGPNGPFAVDLVEQGPHALIAGTSGAGKSELLQTLVTSLAASYSPTHLNFLFVDYKGGAASADFDRLPHNVGSVSNLDEHRSLRALTSLRAELQRRMALMEGRARDLDAFIQVAPDEAPPRLVIVIDEFATLVKEVPAFLTGIVDIAQRGRSLGIHLVLATQRPAGVVSDNILANTNLRIALRVLDNADSSAVIGTTDAAGIPVPLRGRAYARFGPGALSGFQTAWGGAPCTEHATEAEVTVHPWGSGATSGTPVSVLPQDRQLAAVVAACEQAAQRLALAAPRPPWVEPLPDLVPLSAVSHVDTTGDPGRVVPIGLADLPARQEQFAALIDFEASGAALMYGSGGTGKTTALRTIAAAAALQGSPEDVQLYALDFGGRALEQVSSLPHTVAVATSDDLEKTTRMLSVLDNEIQRRTQQLGDARVDAVSGLRSKGVAIPRIIVLVDGLSAFLSAFEQGASYRWLNVFQRIVVNGRQAGVHVVMTNNRQLGVPTAINAAVGTRLVLRMVSNDEMIGLGVPRASASIDAMAAGRAFLNGGTETQVAIVGHHPAAADQADALRELGESLAATTNAAPPELPELRDHYELPTARKPFQVALGVADLSMTQVDMDLLHQHLVVMGPAASGRSTVLASAAEQLAELEGTSLLGIGGLTSPLADLAVWDAAGFGTIRHGEVLERAVQLIDGYEGNELRVVLIIDAVEDVDPTVATMYLERLVRSDAVRLVVTVDAATLNYSYSGWVATLKRNRTLLALQPASAEEVEAQSGVRPLLRPDQPFPPGRGVVVTRGRATLVQCFEPQDGRLW